MQADPMFHNGFVYVEIRKGMYGLPQAGRLANDQLVAKLAPHGYHPCPLTPGLWRHSKRDNARLQSCCQRLRNSLHVTRRRRPASDRHAP